MLVWKASPEFNRFIAVPLLQRYTYFPTNEQKMADGEPFLSPPFFCQNASLSKKKQMAAIPPLPSVLHLVDTRTVALPHTRQCSVIVIQCIAT